jgi:hypothetical protein
VARVLIVGCGCRGRALASALVEESHLVRGTTRREGTLAEIEKTGADAVLADPGRLATLFPFLGDVAVVCWLVGPRLRPLIERLVDTPVRGVVYDGAEADAVRTASEARRIPCELIEVDPEDHDRWLAASTAAVARVLCHPSLPR